MCLDLCLDMRIDMCIATRIDMRIGMRADMRTDKCPGACRGTSMLADMREDIVTNCVTVYQNAHDPGNGLRNDMHDVQRRSGRAAFCVCVCVCVSVPPRVTDGALSCFVRTACTFDDVLWDSCRQPSRKGRGNRACGDELRPFRLP